MQPDLLSIANLQNAIDCWVMRWESTTNPHERKLCEHQILALDLARKEKIGLHMAASPPNQVGGDYDES